MQTKRAHEPPRPPSLEAIFLGGGGASLLGSRALARLRWASRDDSREAEPEEGSVGLRGRDRTWGGGGGEGDGDGGRAFIQRTCTHVHVPYLPAIVFLQTLIGGCNL